MPASGGGGQSSGTPTIYDVAKQANVSIATVSRVLNSHGYLRAETRDRVLQAVRELHFVPNGPARQLSSGIKKVIGLAFIRPPEDEMSAVEEDSLLFTDAVIRGAEFAAQRFGYSLLLTGVTEGDSSNDVTALTGKADGVIVLDRVLPEKRVATLAKRSPLVLLAGSGKPQAAVNVRVDNVQGMQAIAQHLVAHHGFRRFAFMAGKESSPDSTTREEAFTEMVRFLGGQVEPSEEGWSSDWTTAGAFKTTRDRLSSGRPMPEAIVCASDPMALGVLQALQDAGLRAPRDVAVTGFDDIPIARHWNPSLTTVRQPSQQLGSVGVEALVGLIEDRPNAQRDRVLPTQLVVRASCGCPAPTAPGLGLLNTGSWGSESQ